MKIFTLVLFIVIGMWLPVYAQDSQAKGSETINDAYEFPLRPGMSEWGELDSYTKMIEVCQIPESILSRMSTEALIQTCLKYPLAFNFMVHDSFDYGIEQVISNFNGLQELIKRTTAGGSLLKAYKILDPTVLPDCGHVARTVCRFQIMYLELLLGQNEIISNLAQSETISLLEESQSKYYAKRENSDGIMQLRVTCALMSKILLHEDYHAFQAKVNENAEIISFLNGAPQESEEVMREILESVEEYLSVHRNGESNEMQ